MLQIAITRKRIGMVVGMYGVLFIFLATTNPTSLPVAALLAPLLWFYGCLVVSIMLVLHVMKRSEQPAGNYKDVSYAAVLGGIPIGLLLLQSINQLTLKDILLITIFSLMALMYVTRFRLARKLE